MYEVYGYDSNKNLCFFLCVETFNEYIDFRKKFGHETECYYRVVKCGTLLVDDFEVE